MIDLERVRIMVQATAARLAARSAPSRGGFVVTSDQPEPCSVRIGAGSMDELLEMERRLAVPTPKPPPPAVSDDVFDGFRRIWAKAYAGVTRSFLSPSDFPRWDDEAELETPAAADSAQTRALARALAAPFSGDEPGFGARSFLKRDS